MFDEERYQRRARVRAIVRNRAGGRCEICGDEFVLRKGNLNASMHHRKMRQYNGPDSVANLLHLCNPCHKRIHKGIQNEHKAGFKGHIVWTYAEVTPVFLHGERWVVLADDGTYEDISDEDAIEIIEWLMTFEPEREIQNDRTPDLDSCDLVGDLLPKDRYETDCPEPWWHGINCPCPFEPAFLKTPITDLTGRHLIG